MKKFILLLIFTSSVKFSFSQLFNNAEEGNKYSQKEVLDSVYGIKMYDKFNSQIGDSIRKNKKGNPLQGMVEDFYESGKLLHKGYYADGRLEHYKNFYENGVVERNFKMNDLHKSSIQIFYPNGKIKSSNTYLDGNLLAAKDYYPNGQIDYMIENAKNMEHIIFRKSYSEDGKPQAIFELIDKKKNIYSEKEYYENGNLKTEGQLQFNPYKNNYIKNGIWKIYNETGVLVKQEKWTFGEEEKNIIISDEALAQSLQDELAKTQKIKNEENKKVNPAQELKKQYKKKIADADKLFAAKNYDSAKTCYNQASALKPSKTYPKTQIAEIDRLIADAIEKQRIAEEKKLADAAEKERLAKEKKLADAAEKERLAKEKALAEKEARIAKEKRLADAAEKERIAKEKAIADAVEKERIAKEQAIANALEKVRLAKEEEARVLNLKYTRAINTGDSAIAAKNYTDAKVAFNSALTLKPTESYPKVRIEQIENEILKSGKFQNELAKKYPQGITEEIVKKGNSTDTRRIVVIGNKGVLYVMRRTNFGGVYYFKDDSPISESEFKKNTETK